MKIKLSKEIEKDIKNEIGIDIETLKEIPFSHLDFYVNNKKRIEIIKLDKIENGELIKYNLKGKRIIRDFNKIYGLPLKQRITEYFRNEKIIDHEELDWFIYRLFDNEKLLEKYLPSYYKMVKSPPESFIYTDID